MGGQYRITGDKYPRMRRPRRRGRLVFAVLASVAAVGLIGWGTLQLIDVFTGGGGKATAAGAKADCATTKSGRSSGAAKSGKADTAKASASPGTSATAPPQPAQITVNVLNATPRGGLAKETADELKKRGFRIGDVGNAPKDFDKKVKGVAVLFGAKNSLDSSLPVIGTQLTGVERRDDASRTGAAVDLILGDRFTSLANKPDADKALAALTAAATGDQLTKKGC
ncbi:LytR C-terminal domain-containing protein [Streptomyces sp. NPDC048664]|uniref:LytR C-terminal domain-containing protein n=1 Tax=Streptomyces sp. NPDC048664 TaxID=3154505 RepID=UPI00343F41DB